MRILKLKKFEVCHFEEEAVEHDDTDLCLDKLPEESLIVFTEILRESAEAEVRTGLSCECSQLRSQPGSGQPLTWTRQKSSQLVHSASPMARKQNVPPIPRTLLVREVSTFEEKRRMMLR